MDNLLIDDRRYINSSHLAILARLILFPDAPLRLEYLNEYISSNLDDNIRCLKNLQEVLPFICVNYLWHNGQIPDEKPSIIIGAEDGAVKDNLAINAQIILDIINRTADKSPKNEDYKKRLEQLRTSNLLGAEITLEDKEAAKKWFDAYIENYKNGILKGLTNTYKFSYNLKTFLQYLDNSNYELSSFTIDSYDTELNFTQNKILETVLYLNIRKHLCISNFKLIPVAEEYIQGINIYDNDDVLSDSYIRWRATLEFQQEIDDIWRQETIKRDLLLSESEWKILENIMLKEKDIADKLSLSVQTVNTHKKNIFKKLGVHNKRAAYLFYQSKGDKFKG